MGTSSSKRMKVSSSSSFSSFLRFLLSSLLFVLPCLWLSLGRALTPVDPAQISIAPNIKFQVVLSTNSNNGNNQPPPPPPPPSLSDLTNTYNPNAKQECESKAFVYVPNNIIVNHKKGSLTTHKIPKIIHQTSKSRCMTQMFAKVSQKWRNLPGYDYYFHDDESVMQLLTSHMDEFPLLHDLVQANCLRHGTIRADVWRYLVLYVYGGIYADIDTQPTALFFNTTTTPLLKDTDDGWFVVEQFHVLSQYVMAVSPKHPIMYYAIHHATQKLATQYDTGKVNAALVTGPHALHRAFQDFRKDAGVNVDPQGPGYKPVWAGIFEGTQGRSITVVGRGEHEGEFITREMMSLPLKRKQYAKMNMTSFHDDKTERSGQSCLSALYQYHTVHHHRLYKKVSK